MTKILVMGSAIPISLGSFPDVRDSLYSNKIKSIWETRLSFSQMSFLINSFKMKNDSHAPNT